MTAVCPARYEYLEGRSTEYVWRALARRKETCYLSSSLLLIHAMDGLPDVGLQCDIGPSALTQCLRREAVRCEFDVAAIQLRRQEQRPAWFYSKVVELGHVGDAASNVAPNYRRYIYFI